jgi:hypothetical protein
MGTCIQIKGVKEGLLVVREGEWLDLRQDLLVTIDERIDFFRGAKLFIDVGT